MSFSTTKRLRDRDVYYRVLYRTQDPVQAADALIEHTRRYDLKREPMRSAAVLEITINPESHFTDGS
jgi:hypothetical protein